jgi:hypothetical protein
LARSAWKREPGPPFSAKTSAIVAIVVTLIVIGVAALMSL